MGMVHRKSSLRYGCRAVETLKHVRSQERTMECRISLPAILGSGWCSAVVRPSAPCGGAASTHDTVGLDDDEIVIAG
jgi:hypothetical protein